MILYHYFIYNTIYRFTMTNMILSIEYDFVDWLKKKFVSNNFLYFVF